MSVLFNGWLSCMIKRGENYFFIIILEGWGKMGNMGDKWDYNIGKSLFKILVIGWIYKWRNMKIRGRSSKWINSWMIVLLRINVKLIVLFCFIWSDFGRVWIGFELNSLLIFCWVMLLLRIYGILVFL